MPIPDLIEIVPPKRALGGRLDVPGSKSVTNRALILAALATGPVELRGALWSDDTQVMVEALRALGYKVEVELEDLEPCNRRIRVEGGMLPRGGSAEDPLSIFVGNAGTAARFLSAFVCLGTGSFRLHGVSRMHERPQEALFAALRQLGHRVESHNNRLPVVIHAVGPRPGSCDVSIEASSQFASALLLSARRGGWSVRTHGENADESPYVKMTAQMITAFPHRGGTFLVEPDCSSGSYLWAANELCGHAGAAGVEVRHWPVSGWQIDQDFVRYLPLPASLSRRWHLGDSIMTAIVLAPFSGRIIRFHDLGRLRLQECERVVALKTELVKCGARVFESGDTLEVYPGVLHGAEIDTYDDHRMAMCFAVVSLKVPGIRIRKPACVAKTFPDFFRKLAAPGPEGLGVEIVDPMTRRRLGHDELIVGGDVE